MLTEKEIKDLRIVRKGQIFLLSLGVFFLLNFIALSIYLIKYNAYLSGYKIYYTISEYCNSSFWIGFLLICFHGNNKHLLKIIDKLNTAK